MKIKKAIRIFLIFRHRKYKLLKVVSKRITYEVISRIVKSHIANSKEVIINPERFQELVNDVQLDYFRELRNIK